jgi:hypothetical protein
VGLSRRSVWSSISTYRSDLVSTLPARPSNVVAYLCIFLGVCGLLLAVFVGTDVQEKGLTVVIGTVGVLFLVVGYAAKKPKERLAAAQVVWDKQWLCARCGHQWLP